MKSISPSIQHKSFPFQVKAVDDEQGLIEAYGSVFEVVDMGDDVVKAGAFKRTIQNAKSRVAAGKANFLATMLWNHDTEHFLPIGGWYDLKEDSQGLLGKGKIAIDTQLGQDVYKLIKGGFINEFSIGYEIMGNGAFYDKNTGNRNLTELRLWEISPVVFAMQQEALLVGVKSADGESKETTSSGLAYVGEPGTEPLTLPKGSSIHPKEKPMQKKTLLEHYNEEMAEDLLSDWQDVFLCSLTCAMLDALKIGDQVEADISQALDDFKTLVMGKFVTQAQEVGLTEYLQDSAYSYSPADSIMQYGSESSPSYRGLMSSSRAFARKAGRAISGTNADKIQSHADNVHDMANKAMNMMKEHTKALHAAADDIASMAKKPEDAPPPKEQDGQDTSKKPQPPEEKPKPKAASLDLARGATPHSEASTVDEQELEAMLRRLREMREPAPNTLTTVA